MDVPSELIRLGDSLDYIGHIPAASKGLPMDNPTLLIGHHWTHLGSGTYMKNAITPQRSHPIPLCCPLARL